MAPTALARMQPRSHVIAVGEQAAAGAFPAQTVGLRDDTILEDQLRHRTGAQAHLVHFPHDGKSRAGGLDEKGGDAGRSLGRIRGGEGHQHVRHRPVGDKYFPAIEGITAVHFCRGRAQAISIGPALGFAHGVAPDQCPMAKSRQIFFLLLLSAEGHQRRASRPHVGVEGEQQAVVAASVAQALQRADRRERIAAEAAVLDRHRQALDALGPAFGPSLAVEHAASVVLDEIVVQLGRGETLERVKQLPLRL